MKDKAMKQISMLARLREQSRALRRSLRKAPRGVTLFEVLIVVAILAMVAGPAGDKARRPKRG